MQEPDREVVRLDAMPGPDGRRAGRVGVRGLRRVPVGRWQISCCLSLRAAASRPADGLRTDCSRRNPPDPPPWPRITQPENNCVIIASTEWPSKRLLFAYPGTAGRLAWRPSSCSPFSHTVLPFRRLPVAGLLSCPDVDSVHPAREDIIDQAPSWWRNAGDRQVTFSWSRSDPAGLFVNQPVMCSRRRFPTQGTRADECTRCSVASGRAKPSAGSKGP